MAAPHRVVVTGAGIASPLGGSLEGFWRRLERGETGIRPVTRFDTGRHSCKLAGEVDDEACATADGPYAHEIRRAGRFVACAVAASERTLADSGVDLGREDPAASAFFLGVSTGGLDRMESGVIKQETKGPRKVSPYQITSLPSNMAASLIALRHGFKGTQYTLAGACASGSQALGQAFHAIRWGQFSWALAGGCEAILTPITFSSFETIRMLSTAEKPGEAPRPFDTASSGIVLGEGAALFVLEERERALARGARIYAEIEGYATCSGGERVALQSREDTLRSMRLALADAGAEPADVDCVYAQAAGIRQGDETELGALKELFSANGSGEAEGDGSAPARPAITSIKGHIGHTFAASGAFNLAAALGVLAGGRISPTLNLQSVSPEFEGLNLGPDFRVDTVDRCLINTYGFGGVNASLVVGRHRSEN